MSREDIRAERDQKIARLLTYFGVIMAIFYLVMGVIFLVSPWFTGIPSATRYLFSTLLILYGIFRAYRLFRKN